ncbi:MAG: YceI family protein [Saprospiraceae bacterium]|nr:YceI family protein [Saprospiraceae bacterium]
MKNVLLAFVMLLVTVVTVAAQGKFYSKTAMVSFNASTPLEDIDAQTNTGTIVLDTETGKLESSVLVKAFQFKRALMQEHFNENYMESSKYPKAVFKGEITNLSEVNFKKDGDYKVKVKGTMEMHGVKKEIMTNGILNVAGKNLKVNADFIVACADYEIKIPSVVADKVAKEVKVTVNTALQALAGK